MHLPTRKLLTLLCALLSACGASAGPGPASTAAPATSPVGAPLAPGASMFAGVTAPTLAAAVAPAGPTSALVAPPPPTAQPFSRWVFPAPTDPQGRLAYAARPSGDRICDFSYAGYGGGGVALPNVPVMIDLSPQAAGDDTARIQAAIDFVESLPLDPQGLRGAVLLRRGTYRIGGSLLVEESGVVLRGEGFGDQGTILRATGAGQRALVRLQGRGRAREVPGTRRRITDARVSVGALTFVVDDASGFVPGQRVMIHRPSTQEWIDLIGMDADDHQGGTSYDTSDVYRRQGRLITATCLTRPWQPGERDFEFDRVITAVSGNQISVDAPITTALEQRFGGATIYRYAFPGRITQVGVEDLRGVSDYAHGTDEDHGWELVKLVAVEDAWVKRVHAYHFGKSAVSVEGGSRRVTVQDSKCVDPISEITGGRRYSFKIRKSQLVLVQRCRSRRGRHDFIVDGTTPGPNVFLDCEATRSYDDVGPHTQWSSGALFDQLRTDGAMNLRNRGDMGDGQGWAAASCVLWNSRADHVIVQSPPGAGNWAIGCQVGLREGDGDWDSPGTPVWPPSLYLRQLEERLGPQAVAAISR